MTTQEPKKEPGLVSQGYSLEELWRDAAQPLTEVFSGRVDLARMVVEDLHNHLVIEGLISAAISIEELDKYVRDTYLGLPAIEAALIAAKHLVMLVVEISGKQPNEPGRKTREKIYKELLRRSLWVGLTAKGLPVSMVVGSREKNLLLVCLKTEVDTSQLPKRGADYQIEYVVTGKLGQGPQTKENDCDRAVEEAESRLLYKVRSLGGGGGGIAVGYDGSRYCVRVVSETDMSKMPTEHEGKPVVYTHDPPTVG